MENQHANPSNEALGRVDDDIREDILDEIADLETHAARGTTPPLCRGYRVRVNRERHEFHEPNPTRETILEAAGLTPVDRWTLRIKVRGGRPILVEAGERVDFRRPGIESLKALPCDQTEG